MANKSAKTTARNDRQAKIDAIRAQQRSAERRQGRAIVVVCIVVAALIIGLAAYKPIKNWWDLRQFRNVDLASIGAPASVCQKVTTKPATGNQQHVQEGTPLNYTDAPPAFGEHYYNPDPMARKFYTSADRPALGTLVHNLEHGYTIVWYDETAAKDQQEMTELRGIASKMAGTSNLRTKFKAVPWESSDEGGKSFPNGQHIAFTHWSVGKNPSQDGSGQLGVWQYCSSVSGAALQKFMLDYPYTDSPEPGAM